jgi:hypothetical protein
MMHPHTELRHVSDAIGVGVFATRPIPRGTIVWALDPLDRVLEPAEVAALDGHRRAFVDKYSYRDQHGRHVVCWDLGKFVNHSFHANCIGTAYDVEVAVRDIAAGEELTDDYGTLNPEEPFACVPEAGTDRTLVRPDDLLHYADVWDAQALAALRDYERVPQPLAAVIRPEHHRCLLVAARDGILLDSIRAMHCAVAATRTRQ